MIKLFANSGDPDQTPLSAVSDLGLHCLLDTLLGVSRLQWFNIDKVYYAMPFYSTHIQYCSRLLSYSYQICNKIAVEYY